MRPFLDIELSGKPTQLLAKQNGNGLYQITKRDAIMASQGPVQSVYSDSPDQNEVQLLKPESEIKQFFFDHVLD